MGPITRRMMTRCIHCSPLRGGSAKKSPASRKIGANGRGRGVEITSYLEGAVHSRIVRNVVDLCPVGALTSKPYAFERVRGN